ncbi:hypothetical protein MXB_5399 [Myxobolus squamalis]|nr:hypothetical protein MXB_5399 [Myxobolus squamalis]
MNNLFYFISYIHQNDIPICFIAENYFILRTCTDCINKPRNLNINLLIDGRSIVFKCLFTEKSNSLSNRLPHMTAIWQQNLTKSIRYHHLFLPFDPLISYHASQKYAIGYPSEDFLSFKCHFVKEDALDDLNQFCSQNKPTYFSHDLRKENKLQQTILKSSSISHKCKNISTFNDTSERFRGVLNGYNKIGISFISTHYYRRKYKFHFLN